VHLTPVIKLCVLHPKKERRMVHINARHHVRSPRKTIAVLVAVFAVLLLCMMLVLSPASPNSALVSMDDSGMKGGMHSYAHAQRNMFYARRHSRRHARTIRTHAHARTHTHTHAHTHTHTHTHERFTSYIVLSRI